MGGSPNFKSLKPTGLYAGRPHLKIKFNQMQQNKNKKSKSNCGSQVVINLSFQMNFVTPKDILEFEPGLHSCQGTGFSATN